MKKIYVSALVGLLTAAFSGCDNEVDVIGEWKEIPVIYGVLRPQDTATYIKIEKAFLPPNTSALQIAQNPDSLYFAESDLEVKLYANDVFLATLPRVDAALEGYPKDTGIFAQTPNYAYKIRQTLQPNVNYKLELISSRTGETYTTQAQTINTTGVLITAPSSSRAVRWSYNDGNSEVFNDIKFDWREPSNADIYDLTILFKYDEYEVDLNGVELPNSRQNKVLEWRVVQNYIPDGVVERQINGRNFYLYLAAKLSDVSGTNIKRCARNMDAVLDAGGRDLALYIQSGQANDGLISGLFPTPPYSNTTGGYGVFSAIYTIRKDNISLDPSVFDYLQNGEITQKLGFSVTPCF